MQSELERELVRKASELDLDDRTHKQLLKAVRRSRRLQHWYWRTWRWLTDVAVCFRVAYDAALEYYRTRNE